MNNYKFRPFKIRLNEVKYILYTTYISVCPKKYTIPFYVVSHCIKWAKTSWAYSIHYTSLIFLVSELKMAVVCWYLTMLDPVYQTHTFEARINTYNKAEDPNPWRIINRKSGSRSSWPVWSWDGNLPDSSRIMSRERWFFITTTTVCPRSSDPLYLVSYYIKWVTTSWTYSMSDLQSCRAF